MAKFRKRSSMVVGALAFAILLLPTMVWAETVEELEQRLTELERTMNQQIKALEQSIQEKEAERQAKHEQEIKTNRRVASKA